MVWLRAGYGDWATRDLRGARLEQFLADLFASRKFETWELVPEDLREGIAQERPATYADLCAAVYRAYGRSIGKEFRVWGDKNNFYLHHLGELAELYPESRFLHVVRDGRDVACSYREVMTQGSTSPYAPRLPVDIGSIASEWSANVAAIASFLAPLPGERALTIRYEDLTSRPEAELDAVCAWLGVNFEEGMLAFHEENRLHRLEPVQTRDWKRRTLEPISSETVGRYVRGLPREERETFEQGARAALERFDYL